MASAALKLLAGLVFSGWLMIWVMMPTTSYRSWLNVFRAKTSTTYFGRQGTSMLLYTVPILFIALLGCIYQHNLQKRGHRNRLRSSVNTFKRPVLIHGPLGIVSGIELAFCLSFVALLIWFFTCYMITAFDNVLVQHGQKLWQARFEMSGVRLGLAGGLCLAFLFFPVARGSSILPLIGLTSESSIKYHIWLGHIVMTVFTAHGLCFIVYWLATNKISEVLKWAKVGVSNVAGEVALLCGLVMWLTAIPRIRRKKFEVFFYAHHLYALFMVFFLFHVGFSFFSYTLPGFFLFMVDRFLRYLQSRRNVRLVSARLLPSETVELNFSKNPSFAYNPLSVMFINIPSISSLQWHPFTVTSNNNLEPERLSVIIKKEGSWTQKLYQTISSSSLARLNVSVEGPYSPNSMDFLRHDSLVMVSGGSGITPFISIIRELIYLSTTIDTPTPSVLLICSFRTSADLSLLDLILPVPCNVADLSRLKLRIEAFVTKGASPSDSTEPIRTKWFKPNPSDLPISPVLGSNSWLCLGATIFSSFAAFIVLTGAVTRYYIYPIDQNSNAVFPSGWSSLLNLFFICISIAAASSAAVLFNKKRNTTEAKKIQNMETPPPMTFPRSLDYDAEERELESVIPESLNGATSIHFGRRPDLKKMLLECEGSDLGVMASGPSSLRHAVAEICSSSDGKRMHFESISFSW